MHTGLELWWTHMVVATSIGHFNTVRWVGRGAILLFALGLLYRGLHRRFPDW